MNHIDSISINECPSNQQQQQTSTAAITAAATRIVAAIPAE
jgi:hypothetical protein